MTIVTLTADPPLLDEQHIHVWPFDLGSIDSGESPDVPAFWDTLSPGERERAERYRIELPRRQFVLARGQLRRALSHYLGCSPNAVELDLLPNGKPIVRDSHLHFNVTHSGNVGIIVVALRRVGVDVEAMRPMPNAEGLVERFFGTHEREQFRGLPHDHKLAGFFRAWTCKEALLKAVGVGLQDVDRCEVCLDPRRPVRVLRFDAACEAEWRLHTWQPTPDSVAAIAYEDTAARSS